MKHFELNEDQVKEVKKYINKGIEDFKIEYITISLEPFEDVANMYYIKTRTKAKDFADVSTIINNANAAMRVVLDTEQFIFSEIYV
jgi:hypothetical protein